MLKKLILIYILANSVNTKCRSSKLIVILSCKIIIDALEQGAHCLVLFFLLLALSKLLSIDRLVQTRQHYLL